MSEPQVTNSTEEYRLVILRGFVSPSSGRSHNYACEVYYERLNRLSGHIAMCYGRTLGQMLEHVAATIISHQESENV